MALVRFFYTYFLVFALLLTCFFSFGQGKAVVDSLKLQLDRCSSKEEEVDILAELAWNSMSLNLDDVVHYAERAKALGQEIDYDTGPAFAEVYLAWVYIYKGDYGSARNKCSMLFEREKEIQNLKLKGRIYLTQGAIENTQGFYPEALKHYLDGLRCLETAGDTEWSTYALNNIASNYIGQGNHQLAVQYYERALKVFREKGDEIGQALTLGNLGVSHLNLEDYDKAIGLNLEALEIARDIQFAMMIASIEKNLGRAYRGRQNLSQGKVYLNSSLKQFIKLEDKKNQVDVYYELGRLHAQLDQLDSAFYFVEKGMSLAQEMNTMALVYEGHHVLAYLFERKGEDAEALRQHRLYVQLKDSLINQENNTLIADMQVKYETEKTTMELENQTMKLNHSQEQNRMILFISIGGALFLVTIIALIGFGWVQNSKAKKLIAKQKLEIERQHRLLQGENKVIKHKNLQLQLNPHFFFNSLNALREFILSQQTEIAEEQLMRFSSMARSILEDSRVPYISLERELNFLENYITLQHIRFDGRFSFDFDLDDTLELKAVQIPPLLLQPFVENAIEHGKLHVVNEGKLEVKFKRSEAALEIWIVDNGIGIEASRQRKPHKDQHNSLGLELLQERVKGMFEDGEVAFEFRLEISDRKRNGVQGTEVYLRLPLVMKTS